MQMYRGIQDQVNQSRMAGARSQRRVVGTRTISSTGCAGGRPDPLAEASSRGAAQSRGRRVRRGEPAEVTMGTGARTRGRTAPAARTLTRSTRLAEQHDARWLVADYQAGDVVGALRLRRARRHRQRRPGRRIRLSTDIRYQRSADPIDWRWQEHWHDQDGL